MPNEKIKIQDAKNTVVGSKNSAGGDIHFGDSTVVNNIYNGEQPTFHPVNSRKKPGLKAALIKVALVSVVLIGVKVSIDNVNIIFNGGQTTNTTPVVENKPEDKPAEDGGIKKPQSSNIPASISEKKPVPEKPVVTASTYFDVAQSSQVATLNSSGTELPAFHQSIKSRFTEQGIRLSDSYFRPAFPQKFGSSLEGMDMAALRELGLPEKLNCICQIKENIKYEPNEVAGVHMVTARGRIQVHILNLKTGKLNQITFTENGAGISESSALESLEEHLLQSEKLKPIHTQQCK